MMSNNNAINDVVHIAFKYWQRVHKQGRSQYLAGKRSASMHNWFGIPVVVTTTLVGTVIFSTLSENPSSWLKIGTGLVSLLAAVLSALQTFFGFSEQAARHRTAAADYSGVRRRLEVFLVKHKQEAAQDNTAINELQAIADEITKLEQKSPDVADSFYELAKKEFKNDKDPFFTSSEFQKHVDAAAAGLGNGPEQPRQRARDAGGTDPRSSET